MGRKGRIIGGRFFAASEPVSTCINHVCYCGVHDIDGNGHLWLFLIMLFCAFTLPVLADFFIAALPGLTKNDST